MSTKSAFIKFGFGGAVDHLLGCTPELDNNLSDYFDIKCNYAM